MTTNYSYDTLSEALNGLAKRGFTKNFNIQSDCIECKDIELKLHPDDFEILEIYRFEGDSNPGDEEVVYAIESKGGVKGVFVTAFGIYSDELSNELVQKLKIERKTLHSEYAL
ncbi:MAG: phosphoribosylpyrophosphate synthetase [Ignavibacteria bacterium]|nr:phosphoribosylpyrophosphate synthetase [Ignavibacteria bacterium]